MTSGNSSKTATSLTCDQALFASVGKRKNKEFPLSHCHKKCTLDAGYKAPTLQRNYVN